MIEEKERVDEGQQGAVALLAFSEVNKKELFVGAFPTTGNKMSPLMYTGRHVKIRTNNVYVPLHMW
jgi:hypothetical protein